MPRLFMKYITTVSRCSTLYRDKQLEPYGLTGYQAPYLPIVCAEPGITQDAIAQKLNVNRSTVTRQLTLLEEAGYVTRRRSDTDRRALEVYPTERAQEVLPTVKETHRAWKEALTEGFTEEELATLEALTARLAHRAETLKGGTSL